MCLLQGAKFRFQGVAFRLEHVGAVRVGAAACGQGDSGRCRDHNAYDFLVHVHSSVGIPAFNPRRFTARNRWPTNPSVRLANLSVSPKRFELKRKHTAPSLPTDRTSAPPDLFPATLEHNEE